MQWPLLFWPCWGGRRSQHADPVPPAPFHLHTHSSSQGTGFSAKGLLQLWATGEANVIVGTKLNGATGV